MFEPSRLEQQCLQQAYARLIPIVRRRVDSPQSRTHFTHELAGPASERSAL